MEQDARYLIHNSATLVPILSQMNPVHMSHIIFPRGLSSTVLLLSLDRMQYGQYNSL
jgi:hypothetical protein